MLLAGSGGGAWVKAAAELSGTLGIELDAFVVGPGGLDDVDARWAQVAEIEDDGAVLVRPDQHVGWRATRLAADPATALRDALSTILAQRLAAAV